MLNQYINSIYIETEIIFQNAITFVLVKLVIGFKAQGLGNMVSYYHT